MTGTALAISYQIRTDVSDGLLFSDPTPDSLDSSTACLSYLTIRPYYAAPGKTLSSLINGDIIYDIYPTLPTNGNNKWVALTVGGSGLKRAFQISSVGVILNTYNC